MRTPPFPLMRTPPSQFSERVAFSPLIRTPQLIRTPVQSLDAEMFLCGE